MRQPCTFCPKTLANPAGLRRHINSQHRQLEWHACECGKTFLDPAGRSRCRRAHSVSFKCPVYDCRFWSSRKDSVKKHLGRLHRCYADLEVLTVPYSLGSSIRIVEINPAPALASPSILQPQPNLSCSVSSQYPSYYYSGVSPGSSSE